MKNPSLLALMHDTAHPINNSKALAGLVKKEFGSTMNSTIAMYLDLIIKEQENCAAILDRYYTEQKNQNQ